MAFSAASLMSFHRWVRQNHLLAHKSKWSGITLLTVAFAWSIPVECLAQNAGLTGFVRDAQGAVVVKAELRLIDDATGVTLSARTNESGLYVFGSVKPSTYRLEVSAVGFATVTHTDIVLNVDQRVIVDVALALEGRVESVTVSANRSILGSADGSVGTLIDRKFAADLPLAGRSFSGLIALTPGAARLPPGGLSGQSTSTGSEFNVNGQRSTGNALSVDGVGVVPEMGGSNGAGSAGQRPASTVTGTMNGLVSMDALQELRIQTSSFAAEFGRTPGAQISLVTRSGTNALRGTAFEQFRDEALMANDWFANSRGLPKPDVDEHLFGATLGGPLLRSKTFYFFSYEGLRVTQPRVVIGSVPSLEARQQASGLSSVLNLYPQPTGPTRADMTAERADNLPRRTSADTWAIRGDHVLGSGTQAFARYSYSPSGIRNDNPVEATRKSTKVVHGITTGLTAAVHSRILVDLRASYGQSESFADPKDSRGLRDWFPASMPPLAAVAFSASPLSTYTEGVASGQLQRQVNVVGSVSHLVNTHHFKAGVDYRRLTPTVGGGFTVTATFQNLSQALAATAVPTLDVRRVFPTHGTFNSMSLYVQDTWKPWVRLSVTYGVRWDANSPPSFKSGESPLAVSTLRPVKTLSLSAQQGEPLWKSDYNNFYPRLGFSYALDERNDLVVSGGAGLFGDLTGLALAGGGLVSRNTARFTNVPLPLSAREIPFLEERPLSPPFGDPAYAIDPNLATPTTLQWNVGVQKALGAQQAVSVTYVGARADDLLEVQQYPRPNTNFAGSVFLTEAVGRSKYHAMQVQYRRRAAEGLHVIGSYSLSDSKDTTSEVITTGNKVSGLAPSDFDVRHSGSVAVAWNPTNMNRWQPFGWLVRDWGINAIATTRSGYPFTVTASSVVIPGEEQFVRRASLVPGVPVIVSDPTAPGGQRFNLAAFVDPSPATEHGDTGRNAFRGFSAFQLDMGLVRSFSALNKSVLQVRVDILNVLNNPTFSLPIGGLNRPADFGKPVALANQVFGADGSLYRAGGPRSVSVTARVEF